MPSPFPGMDPYIERPEIWPDFHDRLITCIQGALQRHLRPRYVALVQDRLYLVESKKAILPDISILRVKETKGSIQTAVLEADAPVLFEVQEEELREPFIEIIEPAAGNRVITAIEVISPDNKIGEGRKTYERKCKELRKSSTHLVEIDLYRASRPIGHLSKKELDSLRPWQYLVTVNRRKPRRHEVYAIPLARRLPVVKIPLANDDPDVLLDLQAAFTRCYEEGPYPELLRYDESPPGRLTAILSAWCEEIVTKAGFRAGGRTETTDG